MLKIWTGADALTLKTVLDPIMRTFRPHVPPHAVQPLVPDASPPLPEPGGVVLAMGDKVIDQLRKAGTVPKNRTVSSMREKPVAANGGWYLCTFDPAVVTKEFEKQDVLSWDVRLAVRLLRTGSVEPEIGTYRYVSDYSDLIAWINKTYDETGAPVDVSCDTETMGFHPWYPDKDIVSISFTGPSHTADVLYLGPQPHPRPLPGDDTLYHQIRWLLTTDRVKMRMANGKYDLIWIATKWGIDCTNFRFDNLLVGSLLNENRSNGLSLHAKIYTDMGGYDLVFDQTHDKGHMEAIPPDSLLTYAGGDTDATQRAADILRDQLVEDPALARFYIHVLHPAARAFEKMERRGVLVDVDKYQALGEELQTVIAATQKQALDLLPVKMRIKYREKIEDQIQQGKSPLLPSLLKEYFFSPQGLNLKPKERTAKTQEPSMAKSHLLQFHDVPEAMAMVSVLKEMDSASKTLSTFVTGFLKHLRPDGRFHPTYMLFHGGFNDDEDDESGTVTGRLSAKDPAFQTLPKKTLWAKKIRACFPAPKGKVVAALDYSQGELRVVACVANEKEMLRAYEAGFDLHAVTGARLGGVPYDEFMAWKDSQDVKKAKLFEDLRQQAKAGNFGLLYGMGVEGFMAYAWANYGLKLSHAEAEKIRNDFFALYSGLGAYHDRQRKLVRLHEMVRSPLGRIRHLPMIRSWASDIRSKAERQAINCVTEDTEILTPSGWKTVDQLKVGDAAFSVDPGTGRLLATPILELHRHRVDGRMWSIEHNAVSALCTPHHRWLVDSNGKTTAKFAQDLTMNGHDKLWVASEGLPDKQATVWRDDEVRLLGWVLTDGHYKRQFCTETGKEWGLGRVGVTQTKSHRVHELDSLFLRLGPHSRQQRKTGQIVWEVTSPASYRIRGMMPDKTLTAQVLMSMSTAQHRILYETMLAGDGCWDSHAGRFRKFVAGTKSRADAFMMLCALLGQPCRAVERDFSKYTPKQYGSMNNVPKAGKCWIVELPKNKRAQPQYGSNWVDWSGDVWCPSLQFGTWVAKRNGKVFITGNSPIQSTLSDMMIWAIALIEDAYPGGEIEIVGMIHDSLIAYVPEEDYALWCNRMREVMQNLPFQEVGWVPQLTFIADAEVGPNLAQLSKLKAA